MADQLTPAAGGAVAGRDFCGRKRPGDVEFGVVESDRQIFARIMRAIDPVTDICGRRQGLKAVQKSLGHVEVQKICIIEPDGQLIAEGRRVGPDVDDDIMYRSIRAADELGLALSRAAVHPANGALNGPGLRVLEERRAESGCVEEVIEDVGVEGSREEAAFVTERLGNEQDCAGDSGLSDPHGAMLP